MTVKATNQVDIVDLTDGFSVSLSSEAVSVAATSSGAAIETTATTTVTAWCGSSQVDCSVDLTDVTTPTGVTVTKDSSSSSPTLTISISSSVTGNCEVEIPVEIDDFDVTIVKKFSISLSKQGTPGTSVTVSEIKYAKSSTDSQPADSAFTYSSVPSVSEGEWLWTRVTFSDSNKVYTKSKQGQSATQYYTHIRYSANSNGSSYVDTPTSSTKYVGIYTGTSSTAPAYNDSGWKWSLYHGADGEDAIVMEITSSAGFIFKNTQAVTTLTAHVFKGGAEVTGNDLSALGTIKWYKDGGSTAVGTGAMLSITAGTVTNKATYTAKLETT